MAMPTSRKEAEDAGWEQFEDAEGAPWWWHEDSDRCFYEKEAWKKHGGESPKSVSDSREGTLLQEMMRMQQEQMALQQKQMQEQMACMMRMVEKTTQKSDGQTPNIADVKNLMKATTFTNKEEDFEEWRRKTANYICAVTGLKKSAKEVLAACTESKEAVDAGKVKEQFLDIDGAEIDKADDLIFAILDNCTEIDQEMAKDLKHGGGSKDDGTPLLQDAVRGR